ncbi:unnamed protein product [Echinostoma caproni]|uniref:BCAS3 n=1 Tax=Echinostoma caproni TaxID=27848 RepID=A0A183B044_9TREM|nr:unnamed protein product [Echinostoma caproni]
MNLPMRKRSLSCNALGPYLLEEQGSDDSGSSTRKPSQDIAATETAAKVSVVGTLPVWFNKLNRKQADVSQ